MINNDVKNMLNRYLNRGNQTETGTTAADLYKRLKNKHDAIHGRTTGETEEAAAEEEAAETAQKKNRVGKGVLRTASETKAKEEAAKSKASTRDTVDENLGKGKTTTSAEDKLSPEERRKMELKAILDKLEAEEAGRYPYRSSKSDKTEETGTTVITPENLDEAASGEGFTAFLNDLPLFNEFKTGLMDAFKRMDGATAGSISAQYELNYTSMQYIANAAGGYDYEETSFNIKLDLNYIKAAGGGNATGADISKAIESSTDMASLIENLKNAGSGQTQAADAKKFDPNDLMASMQDYFSPEKTAGRILDFATAFFPTSDQFKNGGDTEEARGEFAEIMRKAIQKGFDQAMGTLGKVPKETQDGIDKTHELVFKGIDDFVKNGLNKNKQDNGVYSALEAFAFSAEISYSKKTVSVRNDYAGQNKQTDPTQSALDTQA